jgi:hypothetical protein
MEIKELVRRVDAECDAGMKETGCHPSLWDRVYYAARELFPDANVEDWVTMAEFVIGEEEN